MRRDCASVLNEIIRYFEEIVAMTVRLDRKSITVVRGSALILIAGLCMLSASTAFGKVLEFGSTH
jgi:hypothetical protein